MTPVAHINATRLSEQLKRTEQRIALARLQGAIEMQRRCADLADKINREDMECNRIAAAIRALNPETGEEIPDGS